MHRRGRLALALVTLAAGFFCAVVVAVPFAEADGWSPASWIRFGLKPACHQIPERCLDLGWGPLPVCARCAGLYLGGLVGLGFSVLTNRRIRPNLGWFIAITIPSALDLAFGPLGLPNLSNWPRFGVSLLPGAALGLLLACAIDDLSKPTGENPQPEQRPEPQPRQESRRILVEPKEETWKTKLRP